MNKTRLTLIIILVLIPILVACLVGLLVSPWGWLALIAECLPIMYPLFILSSELDSYYHIDE